MIGKVIYKKLTDNDQINAIISNRIYPGYIPQHEPLDSVVYRTENLDPILHKDGPNALDKIDIQLDLYVDDMQNGILLSKLIRTELDDFSGTMQRVKVQELYYTGESQSEYVAEYGMHLISQTYRARLFNEVQPDHPDVIIDGTGTILTDGDGNAISSNT